MPPLPIDGARVGVAGISLNNSVTEETLVPMSMIGGKVCPRGVLNTFGTAHVHYGAGCGGDGTVAHLLGDHMIQRLRIKAPWLGVSDCARCLYAESLTHMHVVVMCVT